LIGASGGAATIIIGGHRCADEQREALGALQHGDASYRAPHQH
jgi:hypothetical protein